MFHILDILGPICSDTILDTFSRTSSYFLSFCENCGHVRISTIGKSDELEFSICSKIEKTIKDLILERKNEELRIFEAAI